MKLHTDDLRIIVDCADHEEKEKVLRRLALLKSRIPASRNDRTFMIESQDVLYFETVDKRTFLYTDDAVYEVRLRLYEIEEQLDASFIRINKSCILNLDKIVHIRADVGGRILCTLSNKEKVCVSRQYARDFKQKLGGK